MVLWEVRLFTNVFFSFCFGTVHTRTIWPSSSPGSKVAVVGTSDRRTEGHGLDFCWDRRFFSLPHARDKMIITSFAAILKFYENDDFFKPVTLACLEKIS